MLCRETQWYWLVAKNSIDKIDPCETNSRNKLAALVILANIMGRNESLSWYSDHLLRVNNTASSQFLSPKYKIQWTFMRLTTSYHKIKKKDCISVSWILPSRLNDYLGEMQKIKAKPCGQLQKSICFCVWWNEYHKAWC
jgi:hypothetical protein